MNKLFSLALISFLLSLCLVPLVAATVETFTVPKLGVHDLRVNFNQGDEVKFSFTASAVNPRVAGNVGFKFTSPNGKIIDEGTASGIGLSFEAPVTGTYVFHFDNSFSSDSDKIVTLDYIVTYSSLTALLLLIGVLGIAGAGVAVFMYLQRKPKSSSGHVSRYDAMLAEKVNEIVNINDSADLSFEDLKKGILLRCRNAWLTERELYYYGDFFQISDMAQASPESGGSFTIRFKDGKATAIILAPGNAAVESTNSLARFDQETAKDAFQAYMNTRNHKWAEAINKLISKRTQSETIVCEYCGAKNKAIESKCFNCGATLQ